MTDLPYFPLYVSEYEAATSYLSLQEDGMYMRLLRLCWNTSGCTVPNDKKWLQKRLRLTDDDLDILDFIIDEYFTVSNARISQKRLLEEYNKVTTSRKARQRAGSMGGKAKANKTNNKTSSNANDLPLANGKQCSSIKSKNKSKKITTKVVTKDAPKKDKKNGSRISEDWKPSEELAASIGSKEGFTAEQVASEHYDFLNYWLSASGRTAIKRDWGRAFRSWCSKPYCGSRQGISTPAKRGGGSQGAIQQTEAFEKAAIRLQDMGEGAYDPFAE